MNALPERSIALLFLFFFTPFLSAHDDFTLSEVARDFYVHQGKHLMMQDTGGDDIANIGFIIGDRCIAVVDTGGSISVGKHLYQEIRKVSSKPVCYVINTHVHLDHILGNAAFTQEQPTFVGHANLTAAIAANRQYFLDNPDSPGAPSKESEFITPTVTVKDKLELDLGNRTLVLTAYPAAHTSQDLTVYDETTDTLWLSDLLVINRIPRLYGSINGWLEIIEQLETTPYQQVIPGHGPPSSNWPDSITPLKNYLYVLRNDIRTAIAQGQFLEETLTTAAQTEKDKWLLFEPNHTHNVSRAFSELEWE